MIGGLDGDTMGNVSSVHAYVDELGRSLSGPRRAKRDLLTEVHDHLSDATDALTEAGHDRGRAEALAVESFGTPSELAPSYQAVLTVGLSRRSSLLLVAALLVQPLAWDFRGDDPAPAETALSALNQIIEMFGLVALVVAAFTAVAQGLGVRYLGIRDWIIRAACTSTITMSALICGVGFAMHLVAGDNGATDLAYFAAVTLVPLAYVTRTAWRGLATL